MLSAITRGIWAFIALSGLAVLLVAVTDHPLAWGLLSPAGFFAIGAASALLGALLKTRTQGRAGTSTAASDAAPAPPRTEPRIGDAPARPADPFDRLAGEVRRPDPALSRRQPVLTRETASPAESEVLPGAPAKG